MTDYRGVAIALLVFAGDLVGQVVFEKLTPQIARRVVVADRHRFTEAYARSQARVFLQEHSARRFVQFVMLVDRADLQMLGIGPATKPRPMVSFEFWQATFQALASRQPQAAEAIRIGDGTAIRVSTGGETKTVAIERHDPLLITLPGAGTPGKVVLIRFAEEAAGRFFQETDTKDITVFCETTASADETMGVELVKHLETTWGLGRVEVVVRPDDLFAAEPYFPWRPLFGKRRTHLPGLEAYDASPTLICGRQRSGAIDCRQTTFAGAMSQDIRRDGLGQPQPLVPGGTIRGVTRHP